MKVHVASYWLAAVLLLCLLTSTGGCQASPATSPTMPRAAGSVVLTVLPETFISPADSADFQMSLEREGAETLVSISAEHAHNLRALYFELQYDPLELHPLEAAATGTLAPADRLLTLTALGRDGLISHGQVMRDPDGASGFNGSGVLATVRFGAGPAHAAAATGGSGAPGQVSWNPVTHTLSWHYYNQGDYDQNGEVNVADLTPLARHLGEAGPFAPFSIQEVVDGDSNGEINVADITPIGLNFMSVVQSYRVYRSVNPDDAPTLDTEPSSIAPATEIGFDQAQGDKLQERLRFSCVLQGVQPGDYFWARPFDGSGESGALGMAGGANQLTLSMLSAPLSGDGTLGLPYVLDSATQYQFQLMHSELGDVSTDPDAAYTLDPAAAGSLTNADAILRIAEGFSGNFTVSATFMGQQAEPQFIYCLVEAGSGLNLPPTAVLTATPDSGAAPLKVDFDASGSTDPDGVIVLYEWDFDGDGVFEANTGALPQASNTYFVPGTYGAQVRVTDDDGATSTALHAITVGLPGWNVVGVVDGIGFDGAWPQVVDAVGKPGIVFTYETADLSTPYETRYVRATDATAATWTVPTRISPDADDAMAVTDAISVDGNPAALYQTSAEGLPGLYYIRAADPEGNGWGQPVRIDDCTYAYSSSQMKIVDGFPAIVYIWEDFGPPNYQAKLSYVRAQDADGASWDTPQHLEVIPEATDVDASFDLIDGRPALVYYDPYSDEVDLLQATDAHGGSWGAERMLLDASDISFDPVLVAGGRLPTIVFEGWEAELKYMPASDMQASGFETPVSLDNQVTMYDSDYGPRMAWVGPPGSEVPAIAYFRDGEIVGDTLSTRVMYVQAADPAGSSWLEPEIVYESLDGMQIDLAAIDGKPQLAWTDIETARLMYAGRN